MNFNYFAKKCPFPNQNIFVIGKEAKDLGRGIYESSFKVKYRPELFPMLRKSLGL